MRIKRTIRQGLAIARTDFRGISRNRANIFFTLIFPLFFLVIVGFTFGGQGMTATSRINIGVVNLDGQPTYVNGTLSQDGTIGEMFVQGLNDANFTVHEYSEYGDRDSNGTAAYDISRRQIIAVIIIPANFTETLSGNYTDGLGHSIPTKAHLSLYVDPSDATGSVIAQQSILGFTSEFIKYYQEIRIVNMFPDSYGSYLNLIDPITVSTSEADVSGGRQLMWIDYLVPGTLGLVLIWAGLNHSSICIAEERTKGTFQRIVAAPVTPTTVLMGKFISCLAIVYISAFIMLLSGVLLFRVNLNWDIPAIVFLVFLGALSAIGIGLIISSLAKNVDAANSITVLISVPLQFFIGAFFPLSIMPEAAQAFGNILPFTKLVSATQSIATRSLPLTAVVPEILYMAVSGLILFALGVVAYWISLKRP